MAISYKTVKLSEPGKPGGGKSFYSPAIVNNRIISASEFEEMMTNKTRFSRADVVYFLKAMEELLIEQFKNGNIIHTTFIGTFSLSLKQIKALPGKNNYDKSIGPRINFRASVGIKNEMKNAELVQYKSDKNKEAGKEGSKT